MPGGHPEPWTAYIDRVTPDDVAGPHTVEPKVRAATSAGAAVGAVLPFVLWLLGTYLFGGEVPLPVQGFVGFVVTGACTFAAGYYARHVDRVPSA